MLVAPLAFIVALLPLAIAHGSPAGSAQLRHRHAPAHGRLNNHHHVAKAEQVHDQSHRLIRRRVNKRGQQCRPRNQPKLTSASTDPASSTASSVASTTSTTSVAPPPAAQTSSSQDSQATPSPTSSTASAAAESPSPSPVAAVGSGSDSGSSGSGPSWGTLAVTDPTCGWCNANEEQPNGSENWLNCGINGGGWTPPNVSLDQLIAAELDASGVFSPCDAYIDKFKQYGAQYNVHPIMLASFAMQESTCQPWVTGGGGEAGLMQIAPPNCEPGYNCWDPDYNIRRGAQLFRQMIDANGGNVLAAIGNYNGWQRGMTIASATAAKWQGHCRNQNNLDYIFQFVNGWMQNKNAYSMGEYFNLKDC